MNPTPVDEYPFPPVDQALAEPNGLLAAGGHLSPRRLLAAYRNGIFPWSSEGQPVLWWSPDPRMVLFVDEFRMSRSLAKVVRRERFEIRVDNAFDAVIDACSKMPRPGQAGTWITPEVIAAYTNLHQMGNAHSVEAWRDGKLAGGLYGVSIGRMFFGESMFALEADASKASLAFLIAIMRRGNCPLIDCQQQTPHLARLGARPISRAEFAERLAGLVHWPEPEGLWSPKSFSDAL